jgi:hypothetical protein
MKQRKTILLIVETNNKKHLFFCYWEEYEYLIWYILINLQTIVIFFL